MNRMIAWFQAEPTSTNQDERLFWRERILTAVLMGAALLGAAAYLANLTQVIPAREWGWVIVYTLAFAWVVTLAVLRQIPYFIRATNLLAILLVLAVVSALQFGAAGDARVWLMGFVVLSGVFLGLRAGSLATAIAMLTYLTIGWLMNEDLLAAPLENAILQPDNLASWVTTGVAFLGVSLVIILSIGVLVNGLSTGVQRNQRLAEQLERDHEQLARRTRNLERRELQIQTAAEISRTISAELDPDIILQRVVNLLQERFSLYYVGAFVLDQAGRYAVLRAGTGEAGQTMLATQHKLAVGSNSMIGWATSQQKPRIALDVGVEAIFFNNPLLPDTRSELAMPMVVSGKTLGALTVQSVEAEAFDLDDIAVFQGVADSLAIALENANLFQQVQKNLDEIQTLHQQYLAHAWTEAIEQSGKLAYTYQAEGVEGADSSHRLDVPLILRDQRIGNLSIESDQATWSAEERAFIHTITSQAAVALENIRLLEQTRRRAEYEQTLSEFSSSISQSIDIDSVLKIAVRELGRLPNVSDAVIQIGPIQKKGS